MSHQIFAQDSGWSCSCGAVAERQYGLCRKCFAGMTWRKRAGGSARKPAHRRRGRLSRERARILAIAATMSEASGEGSDL